jgi:N-methylhydantoinase A/oxoprolinase/acetone carboxylase beta subunit
VVRDFREKYRERYGYLPDEGSGEDSREGVGDSRLVEIVNVRLEARGIRERPPLPVIGREGGGEPYETRDCILGNGEDRVETPVFRRKDLPADFRGRGPTVVEDSGSTMVIPPGASFRVDVHGNLEVTI